MNCKNTILIFTAVMLCLLKTSYAQVFCYPDGNVIIYSNYDGGYLNIDVDQNIPNLKIGITTYEKCEIHIGGQYASNVVQVIYAGYNGNNDHCNPSPPTTAIYGVSSSITGIVLYPPVTWTNSNGYYYIICNYSCDSITDQGGCNTPDQIVHYYITQFGGSLYYHYTQYGCWQDTLHVSSGGNCCIGAGIIPPQYSINASFSVPNDTLCAKDSVFFFNTSFNTFPGGTTYEWDFGDGTPVDTNANPIHIYGLGGVYTVTLIVTGNGGASNDTAQFQITILDCFTGLNETEDASIQIYPNPVSDKCCFKFSGFKQTNTNIRLYNSSGDLVIDRLIPLSSDNICLDRNEEKLSNGIYFVTIDIDDKRFGTKLLFQ